MAEPSSTQQRPRTGQGAGEEARPDLLPPGRGHWRLRSLLAEFWDNIGDLAAHLRSHWRLILGLGGAAFAGGMLFAWSGLYSVAASSGHYPFFRVFLEFALRQSVETHTIGIQAPPLDDPAMVQRGAGHFQGGCAPCHGAPGQTRNPITRRMLPEPPSLASRIGSWTPVELFWIVKHGIKYAGMPAWVAPAREDEVWSVVAFLQRLPELDVAAYRRLAFGEAAVDTMAAQEGLRLLLLNGPAGNGLAACIRCHGRDGGGGPAGAFPRLQGQTADYLLEALRNYALGTRPSGIMQPVAATLNDAEMRLLATHYATQPATPPAVIAQAGEALALGRRIALEGLPERGVGACAACHGPKAEPPHPLYPRLAGQTADYIATQLETWMRGVRGSEREGPFARIMAHAVGIQPGQAALKEALWPLSRAEMRAVAAWYSAQSPSDAVAWRSE